MKKMLFVLLAVVCIFTSCDFSKPVEDKGTKLVVPAWAENITSVSLVSNNGQGAVATHKAESSNAYEFFSGSVTLTVTYNSLNNEEKEEYLGYGVFDDSEKPFKVFVNGREVENENPQASIPHAVDVEESDIVYLNANVNYFTSTFNITSDVKTVEVTFENAPVKIKNMDLRLADETIYAYIDLSDLQKKFDYVHIWDGDDPGQNISIPRILYGLFYYNRYTKYFVVSFSAKDGYKISNPTFKVTGTDDITIKKCDMDISHTNCYIYCELKDGITNVPGGSIIKITGGEVEAIN